MTMRGGSVRVALVVIVALFLCSAAAAQMASLTGTVTDQTGARVPNADVKVTSSATGAMRSTKTSAEGVYVISQLAPGMYKVEVSATGFKTHEVPKFEIVVGLTTTYDVKLELGQVTDKVIVQEAVAGLNTTDATLGEVLTGRQIQQLPTLSLDPAGLLSLQPGVTFVPGAPDLVGGYSGTTNFDGRGGSVNGSRSDQSNVTLDGIDVNDSQNGFAFQSVLRSTQASLQEFRVITSNANSDAGRSSAAQVQLVTRSGSNELHGSAYWAHRNEALNANDFFLNKDGVDRGKFRRHIYGVGLGGPVVKNRFFLFGNWEELRENLNTSALRDIPSETMRDGVFVYECQTLAGFAACPATTTTVVGLSGASYTIPAGSYGLSPAEVTAIDPLGIGPNPNVITHFRLFPTPNASGNFDGVNRQGYRFASPVKNFFRTWILRADANIDAAANHTIFWRGTMHDDDFTLTAPQFLGLPPNQTGVSNNKGFALGYRALFGSNIVNNFRYGYTRIGEQTAGRQNGEFVDFRFLDNLEDYSSNTLGRILPLHHIGNDTNWVMGNHTVAFGGEMRFTRNKRFTNANSFHGFLINPSWLPDGGRSVAPGQSNCSRPGCFAVPAVADTFGSAYRDGIVMLFGSISQVDAFYNFDKTGATAPAGDAVRRRFAVNEFEWYAQDQWRIRPNLTITAGLRYYLSSPPWEADGNQVTPTPSVGDWFEQRRQLMLAGQPTSNAGLIQLDLGGPANDRPGYYSWDKNNFSPRIGVAWTPKFSDGILGAITGNGKMVIRGGWSLVYDRIGSALAASFDEGGSFGLSTNITSFFGGCDIGGANPCARFTSVTDTAPAAAQSLQPSPGASFPSTPPSGLLTVSSTLDNKIRSPYSHAINLSISRELPGSMVIEAGYVGRRGRKLLFIRDYAMPADLVDPGSGVSAFQAARNLIGYAETNAGAPFQGLPSIGSIAFWENLFPSFGPTGINGGCLQFNIFGLTTNANGSAIPNGQCLPPSQAGNPGLPAGYSATQVAYDYMIGYHGTPAAGSGFGTSTFWQDVDYFGFPGFMNCTTGTDIDGDGFGDCPNAFFPEQWVNLHSWGSVARSEYHAFQFTLRKNFKSGYEFAVNYTLAKSLDHSSTPERQDVGGGFFAGGYSGTAINAWEIDKEYSYSDFDMRHQFNAHWLAELPFGQGKRWGSGATSFMNQLIGGWATSGIVRINSALPAAAINGRSWPTNWNLQGNATCMPANNYRYGLSYGPCPKTENVHDTVNNTGPNIFRDPLTALNSFRLTETGERGGRNNLRADGYFSLDFALAKSFKLPWEGHKFMFRWEVFNLTNSTYFDAVSLNLDVESASSFGQYTAVMGAPRRMQFTLRYDF